MPQMEGTRASGPDLQHRIHALGREAIEGSRPLSELLGEALAELRQMLASVREAGSELERRDREIAELRAELEQARAREPGVSRANGAAPPNPPEAIPPRASRFAAEASTSASEPDALPFELFDRPVAKGPAALEASLSARIAGALFLGLLDDGDRLPSIRELSRRTGLNHKCVRRVFRSLERRGLVEVRDRSGIYATLSERQPSEAMQPVDAWMADVVAEAIQHGMRAGDLPRLFQRSVDVRKLRCACVDSTEDDRLTLCHEIGVRFGMHAVPVALESGMPTADLGSADLVVTTPFHADEVRKALSPGQPLVVACLHPAWRQAVEEHASEVPLRLVCIEPAAGERLRHGLGPDLAQRVRVVELERAMRGGVGQQPALLLATGAAASRLAGSATPPPDLVIPPYLSPLTARRLAHVLVELNRRAQAD